MKHLSIWLIVVLLTSGVMSAQEQQPKPSKFYLTFLGGIGYANIKNDKEPDYNLSSNGGEILLNYRINNRYAMATGVGLIEMSGNGFNSLGNFYHKRGLVKLPVLLTTERKIADNIKMIGNFGFYAQNIVQDEYQFLNESKENVYKDWSWGCQLGLGVAFKMNNHLSAGFNYTSQSDLSKIKTQPNKGITDQQIMKNLSYFSLVVMLDL